MIWSTPKFSSSCFLRSIFFPFSKMLLTSIRREKNRRVSLKDEVSRTSASVVLFDNQQRLSSFTAFFSCTLLACHEGRGRSPSVSEMGEKTDFLTFQLNCKNIQQINQQCKQTNYCQGGLLSKTEDLADGRIMAPYPSVARMSWGFRDTTDGECIGTGTQRNRRSDS